MGEDGMGWDGMNGYGVRRESSTGGLLREYERTRVSTVISVQQILLY